eukprot:g28278.t1
MGQDFGKGTDEHEAGAQYPQPVAPRKCIITPASNGTKCVQTEHGAIANGAKIQLGDIRHRNNPASYLPQVFYHVSENGRVGRFVSAADVTKCLALQGPARKWASINLLDIQPDDQAQQWIVEEGVVKSALDPSLCLHLRLARTVKGTSIFLWRYRRNLFMAHQSFVIRYLNEIPVNQAVEQAMGAEAKTTQLSAVRPEHDAKVEAIDADINVHDFQQSVPGCELCMNNQRSHAIVPCGHMYMCADCAVIYPPAECGYCREQVTNLLHVRFP